MNSHAVDPLLPWEKVLEIIPLSRRDIERRIASNRFPKPCKLGKRTVFPQSEIHSFVEQMKEARQ